MQQLAHEEIYTILNFKHGYDKIRFVFQKKKNVQEIIRSDRIKNQWENYEAIQLSWQVMKGICFFE